MRVQAFGPVPYKPAQFRLRIGERKDRPPDFSRPSRCRLLGACTKTFEPAVVLNMFQEEVV
jgi:hypothetical protein